jgi:hypothetical protein
MSILAKPSVFVSDHFATGDSLGFIMGELVEPSEFLGKLVEFVIFESLVIDGIEIESRARHVVILLT